MSVQIESNPIIPSTVQPSDNKNSKKTVICNLCKKIFIGGTLVVPTQVSATPLDDYYPEPPTQEYFDLIEKHPDSLTPLGDYTKGEIQIVLDPKKIASIQKNHYQRLLKKGTDPQQAREFCRVGIISRDPHWTLIRDAVIFPKGATGLYNRLLWSSMKKTPGVAIVPILPDGRVVLDENYRHSTRSRELELPRGLIKKGENEQEAALRETKEETGMKVKDVRLLGKINIDSGVMQNLVPVYAGTVHSKGQSSPEYTEAISGLHAFSIDELVKGLRQGFLIVENQKIPLRDPFLALALSQLCNE